MYFVYAMHNMINFRQHVMEASDGLNNYFLTNPNADKNLAFAFEFPMSGAKNSQFFDNLNGLIERPIINYIEISYSSDQFSSFDIEPIIPAPPPQMY
jgi:hypothetical protein